MKKILITILLVTVFLQGSTYAQVEKTNAISLSWGIGKLKRQDVNFSPFVFNPKSSLNVSFDYEHTGKLYQRVYTRFGNYSDTNGDPFNYLSDMYGQVETLPHTFNILDLNYTLGFKTISNDKLTLLVGGQVRNQLNVGDYNYGESGIGYYNFAFGLDLWSGLDYKLTNKHHIGAELSLPLVSWVTRSPYLGQDDQYFKDIAKNKVFDSIGNYIANGELQSWESFQRFDFQLKYRYAISDKWSLKASYNLSMNFSNLPQSYTSIENLVLFGAQLNF